MTHRSPTLVRRAAAAAVTAGLLLAATVSAPSAPIVGSGGPVMLPPGSPPLPIWPPAGQNGNQRVGVTVRVAPASQGRAQVQGTSGPTQQLNLGLVSPGNACVFEGIYQAVMVRPIDAGKSAIVSWEERAPTLGYSGEDGVVGSGSIDLHAGPGDSFDVYANQQGNPACPNVYRLITVRSSPMSATEVRVDDGMPVLVTVGANDWSFAGKAQCPGFNLSGQGLIEFMVSDMRPSAGPCSGNAIGLAGETDRAFVDGGMSLAVKFTNIGPGVVRVTSAISNGPPAVLVIQPGPEPVEIPPGLLTRLDWTYVGPATVTISVSGGP